VDLRILHIDDKCTGCGACISICPKNALTLLGNSEGFYYPKLDENACINCHLCERACQVFEPAPESDRSTRINYMAKAKDPRVVSASSSGGAFSMLASKILSEGGVVYGARYDYTDERLVQDSTDNCTLDALRKSKYIESYTGEVFKEVGEHLRSGRKVLYVGTPCQIEGLAKYLQEKRIDRDNLLLAQFVCHGVPSNNFFTEYKRYEEKKHKSKIVAFDFRPKIRGWRNSDWKMIFENGKVVQGPYYYYYYYYYYYFQSSNILRKSCYSCHRVLTETPDITIGDFWGIHKYQPENKDNEGISLIIAHNAKANDILQSIDGFEYLEEIPQSALEYITREVNERSNKSMIREHFMKEVLKVGYMNAAKKQSGRVIFKMKTKNEIRNFIKKICRKK